MTNKTITAKRARTLTEKYDPLEDMLSRIYQRIEDAAEHGVSEARFMFGADEPMVGDLLVALEKRGYTASVLASEPVAYAQDAFPEDSYADVKSLKYRLRKALGIKPKMVQPAPKMFPSPYVNLVVSW